MNPKQKNPEPDISSRRVSWLWLAGLLAAVLVIKAVVLFQLGSHPMLQPHGDLDPTVYVELGQKIARGGPLAVTEPFFVSPLYVYFLALIFKVAGGSLFAVRVVQILLGTAAIGFLFFTARHWYRGRTAWIAAALAALTGFFTFSEILILQAALDPFLAACSLYFISRTQVDPRPWVLPVAGFTAGLFVLNRPNVLAYVLIAAALIAVSSWRRPARGKTPSPARAGLWRGALFAAGLALALAPNALRNYMASGEAVLISSHGGLNFYMGNRAGADGTYLNIPGITPSISGQARDATLMAEAASGRKLSSGEVSSYFYREATDWILANPADAAQLMARKVELVLNTKNVALNYSYEFYRDDEPTLLPVLAAGPWLLLPLGLVGLFLARARIDRPGFWVWGLFVPVYILAVAAFFVSDRYRMPLLIPLCITSAAALEWLIQCLRARQLTRLVVPVLAIVLLAVLSRRDLGLQDAASSERTRKAVWLVEQGKYAEAGEYVNRISARHARPGILRYQVGEALLVAGQYREAVGRLSEALRIDGDKEAILLSLGQALIAEGRPAEAIAHLKTVFDRDYLPGVSGLWLVRAYAASGQREEAVRLLASMPDSSAERPETAFEFGSFALQAQAPEPAERWLRIAAARAPGNAEAHGKLGMALLMLNRPQEALAPLEEAVRLDPASATSHLNLGIAYANLTRFGEARAQAQHALRLDPNLPNAAAFLKVLPKSGN
jgi:tetratricopeptide (TPR) repeat protein